MITRKSLSLVAGLTYGIAAFFACQGAVLAGAPAPAVVRLPGHVPAALSRAIARLTGDESLPMTLTVVLKRDDQSGFDRYLAKVYDPHSKQFRRFLDQEQIAKRFGPSQHSYDQVLGFLRGHGLELVQGSKNRLTLTVHGTRAQVDEAFALTIRDYSFGSTTFHASDTDPAVPPSLAAHIESISGLSDFGAPKPGIDLIVNECLIILAGLATATAYVGVATGGGAGGAAAAGAFAANPYWGGLAVLCGAVATGAAAGAALNQGGFAASGHPASAPPPAPPCTDPVCLRPWVPRLLNGIGNGLNYLFNPTPGAQGSATGVGSYVHHIARVKSTQAPAPHPALGVGQTIGLVEFDGYRTADVSNYLALMGSSPNQMANLTSVAVNGGIATPGANENEVLLDIDTAMTLAPGAKIAVYEAPFRGQAADYSAIFNAMINGGVTVISNSWASCEDQVSRADAMGIDSVLQNAAAAGISVFNGTGDSGSTCLDGAANTISVPADSPNATAVGGTSLTVGSNFTYGSETWWDGSHAAPSTGQGGYGVSRYFTRPSYQDGQNTSAMRSVPDVSVSADPANGFIICQADSGGCPTGALYGGTSLAAPIWASIAALINSHLGRKLGAFNPHAYPLANTKAFHTAASMGSDFAHVGLGSPSINNLSMLLNGETAGTPDATLSQTNHLTDIANATTIPVQPSVVADGAAGAFITVSLYDANGNSVGGKTVTLAGSAGSQATVTPSSATTDAVSGSATFKVTDLTVESPTFTATDTSDSVTLTNTTTLIFAAPPATSAGINVAPNAVAADGQTAATITVTLKDSNNRATPGKTIVVSDGSGHAVITGPASGVTDANGQIQFSATDQVNETVTFTAIDLSDGNLPVPGSGSVTYSGSVNNACGVGVSPVAGTGFALTPFITGMPAASTLFYGNVNYPCPGVTRPVFPSGGSVLLTDSLTGGIYQTPLAGGAATSLNIIKGQNPSIGGMTYGKDGALYASQGGTNGSFNSGSIVQLDPETGEILRTVASGLTCPYGLAVDPLSGDLFFTDSCGGGGSDNPSVFRVIDPANTDSAHPTSVVVYATMPGTPNAGIAFAPNGTMYVVGYTAPFGVQAISATNSSSVTVTQVTGVNANLDIAIGGTNTDGSAQSLIVQFNGALTEIPLADPAAAVALASVSPGVGVAGPDGCLYSTSYDTVYKLTKSDGTCNFAPTSPAPSITLDPKTVTGTPTQGGAQTFTATLRNVVSPAGVPVFFTTNGANNQFKVVETDSTGTATLNLIGGQSGTDIVSASATLDNASVTSNLVKFNWAAGKHLTALSLNSSPKGGTPTLPINAVTTLLDAAVSPVAGISGQSVTFTLGSSNCTATTDAAGVATCVLTPATTGSSTLTAQFAGTSGLVPGSASITFNVMAAPAATPAPTATIAASPATITVGSSATLTWSSTNATSCTASGGWTGSVATSGSQTVTPSQAGTSTYTLNCTGDGGQISAAASVTVNSSVTVSGHHGGGAWSWPMSLILGLILALRGYFSRQRLNRPSTRWAYQ